MSRYQKEDFKRVGWSEYIQIMEVIYDKVARYLQENDLRVDMVVPILRGGSVIGTYLAYRLHIIAMMPVQYKYFFQGDKAIIKRLADYPKLNFSLPESPTFLLVEGNHCFGNTAQTAANDLKERFPNCKIIYVADHMDASHQTLEGVESIFYGRLTDECRGITTEEAEKLGVERGVSYLFPWEDLEEEWTTVSGKQFEYQDQKTDGKTKMELKLGEEYL